MTTSPSLTTDLRWNERAQRLEGTLLGVEDAAQGRGCAYQGELATGEVVTVYWTGWCRMGEPELRVVDTPLRQVSGRPTGWRWFARLEDVR